MLWMLLQMKSFDGSSVKIGFEFKKDVKFIRSSKWLAEKITTICRYKDFWKTVNGLGEAQDHSDVSTSWNTKWKWRLRHEIPAFKGFYRKHWGGKSEGSWPPRTTRNHTIFLLASGRRAASANEEAPRKSTSHHTRILHTTHRPWNRSKLFAYVNASHTNQNHIS